MRGVVGFTKNATHIESRAQRMLRNRSCQIPIAVVANGNQMRTRCNGGTEKYKEQQTPQCRYTETQVSVHDIGQAPLRHAKHERHYFNRIRATQENAYPVLVVSKGGGDTLQIQGLRPDNILPRR